MLRFIKDSRVVLTALIITSTCYFISLGRDGGTVLEHQCHSQPADDNQYISPLCNCAKMIPVTNREALNRSDQFHWCSVESDLRGDHQRVVSYTLFGDAQNVSTFRRYYSQMRNISLTVEKLYPGWTIRFYHTFTEQDRDAYKSLCDIYCRFPHVDLCSVREMWERIGNDTTPIDPALLKGLDRRMHRYLVMMDPQADVFISRDIDSLIFRREVDAVNQWIQSNYTFHLMRDHPLHGGIFLAGMWGAKIHQRRDLVEGLTRALILAGQGSAVMDQNSLSAIVWPVAKYDVMAHDSYHCQNNYLTKASPLKLVPFPTQRDGRYYVGGAGHELYPEKCPVACRPPDHQDWEYC